MHIKDLLDAKGILLNTTATSKQDAINKLAELMDQSGKLVNKEVYLQDIMTREESGSTGLGDGIAIPHAKSKGVKTAGLAVMTIPGGLDFDSMDELPARLFFMIAAPTTANDAHLAILSHLATMIMDTDFKEALIAAKTPAEFIQLIDDKEAGRFVSNQPAEKPQVTIDESKKILAVTACPTGIAHTFMAAESLEQVAQSKGIWLKVEKNASAGTIDGLTSQEIAEAHCIIIAADKNVEMARFDGKPLIKTKVANGINKAEELLDQALNGHVPVYHHKGSTGEKSFAAEAEPEESVSRQIYKHLMNGVSHMLPFVIGGGILIALAFLFDTFDPANPGNFGSNTPLAAFLKNIGGISFGFMLPVLAGYIAMSIADRPGLAVGFVGGALASSGGSGFLGALLAGFAAGYIILFLKKIFKYCLW